VQRESRRAVPRPTDHWLGPACGWLALGVPLIVTVLRVSAAPAWRDDLPIVRGLALVPVGGEGTLSTVLGGLAALLPVGGRLLRAALVSALGLALGSRCIYALAKRALDANATTPRLTPPLALAAALTATLAPAWQLEGTIGGGATLAAALLLAGLLIPIASARDARLWFAVGAFVALTAFESHDAALALLGALGVQLGVQGELPSRPSVLGAAAGFAAAAALCSVPTLLRPLSGHAWMSFGYGVSAAHLTRAVAAQPGALAIWFRDVGVVSMALAAGGGAWGLVRDRTRPLVAPLAALVVFDVVFPASAGALLTPDELAPVRLGAIAALAVAAAIGVHTAALAARRARLPMAQPAGVLLVVFQFTLVLVTAEDSGPVADRHGQHGAEVWTDEALGRLPIHSLLLVQSPAVAWRLWAARVVRGERPDLVVVPLPLLDRGSIASELLGREPKLAPLIRDMMIDGKPSEYALSTLAAARPLYVELGATWDQRLIDHLVPAPLGLRFAPHALGRSDRQAGLDDERQAFSRVLAAATSPPGHRDRATLSVLGARVREQAVALAALGDRKSVAVLLGQLERIDQDSTFVSAIQRRLGRATHGRIDVAGLL
jgi:hypothetical protein